GYSNRSSVWPTCNTCLRRTATRTRSGDDALHAGTPAVLRSHDGQVAVHVPAHAANRALTLRHAHTPLAGAVVPPDIVGFKRGLGILALDTTDDQGTALHQFAEPLTIRSGYTPEQLQAHGIAEVDLTLFWFDDAHQAWVPIPMTVDPATQTASAVVDHFTNF